MAGNEIAKAMIHWGVLSKTETTPGTAIAVSAGSDGVQLIELPNYSESYAFDGARGRPAGTGSPQVRLAPNGRTGAYTAKIEGKGAGSAYSASVKPRDLHTHLLSGGFSGTVVTTGGSETWTYAITAGPTGYSTHTSEVYEGGELHPLNGCMCNVQFEVTNGGPGIFTFPTQGRVNAAYTDDAATPKTITYAPTILPPTAAGLTLSVNSVTSNVVRSFKFDLGRELNGRVDLNAAGGYAGFAPNHRDPVFSFVIEAPPVATQHFWTLRSAGTTFAASLGYIGSTQYNKYKWSFPQAQVSEVKRSEENGVAMLEVTCTAHASSPILSDAVSLLFD